ncbi:MAG: hypothetical protein ACK5TF_05740 [bacterium]
MNYFDTYFLYPQVNIYEFSKKGLPGDRLSKAFCQNNFIGTVRETVYIRSSG